MISIHVQNTIQKLLHIQDKNHKIGLKENVFHKSHPQKAVVSTVVNSKTITRPSLPSFFSIVLAALAGMKKKE